MKEKNKEKECRLIKYNEIEKEQELLRRYLDNRKLTIADAVVLLKEEIEYQRFKTTINGFLETIEKISQQKKKKKVSTDEKIDQAIKEAEKDKESIIVVVDKGLVEDVKNLPEGFTYTLIDRDWLKQEGEDELKEFLTELKKSNERIE
ncbi:MAG: hypothetical protein ACOC5T_07070 [Elusimicrobiota bacterium]